MRSRLFLATLILLVSSLAAPPFIGWGSGNEVETTRDIGARVSRDVQLSPDSFVPELSHERAIAVSREFAARGFNRSRSEIDSLPVDSTVARFTGKADVPRPELSGHRVRVVVFKEFNFVSVTRPYGFTARYGDPRYTLVLDDATGEVIYSVVTHRKLE